MSFIKQSYGSNLTPIVAFLPLMQTEVIGVNIVIITVMEHHLLLEFFNFSLRCNSLLPMKSLKHILVIVIVCTLIMCFIGT